LPIFLLFFIYSNEWIKASVYKLIIYEKNKQINHFFCSAKKE